MCLNKQTQAHPPFTAVIVDRVWERIQIDLMDYRGTPSAKYRWILHIRDHYSKFSCLFALKRKTAEQVAKKMDLFFRIMGVPILLHSDNGSEFKGACLLLMKRSGIKVVTGNSRSPNVQGSVERGNQDAKQRILKYVRESKNPLWHQELT